jgi:hypothetical protein
VTYESVPAFRLSRRSLVLHATSAVVLLGASGCEKAPASCNDVSGLSPEQQSARNALGYEDATPQPGKTCAKCAQYVPAPKVSECGKCKVLPGSVHPNGYCRAFVAKS